MVLETTIIHIFPQTILSAQIVAPASMDIRRKLCTYRYVIHACNRLSHSITNLNYDTVNKLYGQFHEVDLDVDLVAVLDLGKLDMFDWYMTL